MTIYAEFYDMDERDWFDWSGEMRSTGYAFGYPTLPIYIRRSDRARGWFPGTGRRFTILPEGQP